MTSRAYLTLALALVVGVALLDTSRRAVGASAGAALGTVILPNGQVAFAGPVDGQPGLRALFVQVPPSDPIERITHFASGQDRPLAVLDDGRLAFRHTTADTISMMTVEPDGTGLAAFAGPLPDPVRRAARPPIATSLVDRQQTRGRFLCLDAGFDGRRGGGRKAARVQVSDDKGPLGDARVAEDGSFFIDVPADRPLRLATLDAQGVEIAHMTSDVWVRPNENRGCIGCHEPPDILPANRRPLAVLAPPVAIAPDRDRAHEAAR